MAILRRSTRLYTYIRQTAYIAPWHNTQHSVDCPQKVNLHLQYARLRFEEVDLGEVERRREAERRRIIYRRLNQCLEGRDDPGISERALAVHRAS